ncbi:MAG: NADH-quinone oxidoreductase subunit J [Methylocystaceae bacterium]|nr:NADH-quinone oxidoreductase subunit J [Methylocystaceae bacterium]NBT96433.1 NADH-quinone oxidoreductase subunit J [Methylocystaceae bacterium]
MAAVLFYIFATIMIGSACVVIFARNPVHSVLFLILAFCNGAGLFLLAGAEFLAMILIVVYVGAVAVLFLFVVMMLDVDFAELKQGFAKHLPLGLGVGVVVMAELGLIAVGWQSAPNASYAAASPMLANISNTAALGQILYTKYAVFFEASAMVLLTAMIGAIVLTLHHRPNVKRQKISDQNARTRDNVIEIKKVPFRTGV